MPKSSNRSSSTVPSVEVTPPPRQRRKFTAADKLRIVQEAATCERGDLAALLRREGLYSSHLAAWRKELALHGSEGLAKRKAGRPPKGDARDARIFALEKTNARLERELELSRKLIALQKKVSELLGVGLLERDEP